jgi:hypothetical protein
VTIIAPPPPAPPAAAPPPLTPGGRTALRAVLVVFAAVLIVGCVAAAGATAWGLSTLRVVADEKALPADMRSLVIDTGDVSAAVRLTTDRDAKEPTASMRLVNVSGNGDHSLVVAQESGSTRVTVTGGDSRFMDWGRAGEITVTLPPELARRLSVTVQQDDGVLLAQADVDQLVARNSDGAVILSGAARTIEVDARDGDVVARAPISVTESFIAHTVDGDVHVDFTGAPPRTVEVTTRDGDIAVSLPDAGPYLVDASADSSTIRVPQTNDPSRAAAKVTVRSVDGDVAIDTAGRR